MFKILPVSLMRSYLHCPLLGSSRIPLCSFPNLTFFPSLLKVAVGSCFLQYLRELINAFFTTSEYDLHI